MLITVNKDIQKIVAITHRM